MTRPPFYPFRSEPAKAEYEAFCAERAKAWPLPFETRLFDTTLGPTFVRISGQATDPPLVLLHGARGGSLMWVHLIGPLSARYRTFALDTIGDAGFSVNRQDITKPEQLVQWLDETLQVLVPRGQVNLMGISYGGWISALYALRAPERVRSVVMLAPGCTVLKTSFAFVARIALLSLPIGNRLRRTMCWLFKDAVNGDAASRALVEEAISDVERVVRLFALPRPPWPTVLDDSEWRQFRVPGLFLVGENEKIYSPQAAVRRIERVAPKVKTEIIPGAGHDLTMVRPDLVIKKVLEFLDEPEGMAGKAA
jgi:pimeloyl-ACP methyl ester carboxylesterase